MVTFNVSGIDYDDVDAALEWAEKWMIENDSDLTWPAAEAIYSRLLSDEAQEDFTNRLNVIAEALGYPPGDGEEDTA